MHFYQVSVKADAAAAALPDKKVLFRHFEIFSRREKKWNESRLGLKSPEAQAWKIGSQSMSQRPKAVGSSRPDLYMSSFSKAPSDFVHHK